MSIDLSKPPKGWARDELSQFLDLIRNNQFASYERGGALYRRLKDIDDCFVKIGNNLINPNDVLAPLLLGRAHGAYRTACGTALAGQTAETFVLLRMCVEAAGYALLINSRPSLSEVWLRRSEDKAAVRREFTHGKVSAVIEQVDPKLAGIYEMLYERAIDFGAHPNEMSVTAGMEMEDDGDRRTFTLMLLDSKPIAIAHAMKSTAQAGLCSLFIFQHIFSAKFELLGLKHRLQELRKGL